jgi:hypothetical protein
LICPFIPQLAQVRSVTFDRLLAADDGVGVAGAGDGAFEGDAADVTGAGDLAAVGEAAASCC